MNIDAISNAVLEFAQSLNSISQILTNATTISLLSGSFTTVNVTSLVITTTAVVITVPSAGTFAGSGIGSLNNTPGFGGDPQFWLGVSINGVPGAIPVWNV